MTDAGEDPRRTYISVAAGKQQTLAVAADGSLWDWQAYESHQLGLGDDWWRRDRPARVGTDDDWASVTAGMLCALALKRDGSLWAWGTNNFGQLGLGDLQWRDCPTRVGDDRDWASVRAGSGTSLALKGDSSLWAWGNNRTGELGLVSDRLSLTGDSRWRVTCPMRVGGENDWAAVAGGLMLTVALKRDGSLWAWGTFVGGLLAPYGDRPRCVVDDSDWASVAAGSGALALRRDGSLWAWGRNGSGELGLGDAGRRDRPTRVGDDCDWVSVAAHGSHTLALKRDGSLWAWGANAHGQLGLGDLESRTRPARVGDDCDWASVAPGGFYTLALKRDGSLWAWGDTRDGYVERGEAAIHKSPGRLSRR